MKDPLCALAVRDISKMTRLFQKKGRGEEEEFIKMTSGTSAGYLPETRDEENNNIWHFLPATISQTPLNHLW